MNKWTKILLYVVGVVFLILSIDLTCIFTTNKPLFAIKDKNGYVYRGLFYDVYNCPEYSTVQIKPKQTKLACSPIIVGETEEYS